jgi:hypothetical protein
MGTYYLNKDSITEDGTTPETGYHTFYNCLNAWNGPEDYEVVNIVLVTDITETYSSDVYLTNTKPGGGYATGVTYNIKSDIKYTKRAVNEIFMRLNDNGYAFIFNVSDITGCNFVIQLLAGAALATFDRCKVGHAGITVECSIKVNNCIFDSCNYSYDTNAIQRPYWAAESYYEIEVYNCLFYYNINTCIADNSSGSQTLVAFTAQNNTFIGKIGDHADCVYLSNNAFEEYGGCHIDNNDYYNSGSLCTGYAVEGSNNITDNPKLVDPPSSFILQYDSACIAAGIITAFTPTDDYVGSSRTPYNNLGPYQDPAPEPTTTTTTTSTTTTTTTSTTTTTTTTTTIEPTSTTTTTIEPTTTTTTPAPTYYNYKYVIVLKDADLSYLKNQSFSFYITSGCAYNIDPKVINLPNVQIDIGIYNE